MTEQGKSSYWEIVVLCENSALELISNALFEEGASGLEEKEIQGDRQKILAFFTEKPPATRILTQRLLDRTGLKAASIEILPAEPRAAQDWQSNWKEHFKPIELANQFRIRPPWEKADPTKKEIVIDPGQGFGTGYHESTSLALNLMIELASIQKFDRVADVGCGSGILSILSILSGATYVTACDIDPQTLLETHKNLGLSGLESAQVKLVQGSADQVEGHYDLVIANIIAPVLIELAKDLTGLCAKGSFLIISGMTRDQEKEVLRYYIKAFETKIRLEKGDWVGHVLSLRDQPT